MSGVVVVGSQWGDEGKGKIVDWLSSQADVVIRFQGGNNAGHTLVIDGETYMIPLWNKQLVYEHKQNELYVKCQPKLDNNIVLDEKNNLYLDVHYKLNNVWKQPYLYFELGEQTFEIPTSQLYMVPQQTYTLHNQGITRINKQNIYDVTKKGHIYVTINVE